MLYHGDLISLGYTASELMLRKNRRGMISYHITRNINYTNICMAGCRFCAFYKPLGHPQAYVLSIDEVINKAQEVIAQGAKHILLQGGLHPKLDLTYFCRLFSRLKENMDIHIHALSPPEIVHLSNLCGLSVSQVLIKLINAGLDSMPGGGAEILAHRVRQRLSPNKCTASQWLEVMACAHNLGLPTTATMMFGHIESYADRINHLMNLRNLQDETGGFTAFIPWSYQPGNTSLGGHAASAAEYLRTLAVCRIILDNFPLIQASIVTQGLKIAQIALKFGANDIGEVMLEENVVKATGLENKSSLSELLRLIEDLGYIPQLRQSVSFKQSNNDFKKCLGGGYL